MPLDFSREIIAVIAAALVGGVAARLVKLQPLLGYVLAGFVLRLFFPASFFGIQKIAQLGLILLLFSIGLELPLARIKKVIKVSLIGALIQIILVTLVSYLIFTAFHFDHISSLILAFGFSLSSTAIVIKTLLDRHESGTIYAEVMIGWLLVQDLTVIPAMMFLNTSVNLFNIGKIVLVIGITVVLARLIFPRVLRFITGFNLRELTLMLSVGLAYGTALLMSALGVPATIGAFIAGVTIAGSYEHYSIFTEVRSIKDLFVSIFFVSLGFLITPAYLLSALPIILLFSLIIILVKSVVNFIISLLLGYHGRTAVAIGVGLSQVGEFSFVLFSMARGLNLITDRSMTIGIAVTLLSLIIFLPLYAKVPTIWRWLRGHTARWPKLQHYFLGWNSQTLIGVGERNPRIIICGYGRVGGWIGRAIDSLGIGYSVIDYDQHVVEMLKRKNIPVIYGDPSEKEILEVAGIKNANALVVAVPDRETQEAVISTAQTLNPRIKIITRAHTDADWTRFKDLKVDKIIQPEFEAATAAVRSILTSMGMTAAETAIRIRSLRQARTLWKTS